MNREMSKCQNAKLHNCKRFCDLRFFLSLDGSRRAKPRDPQHPMIIDHLNHLEMVDDLSASRPPR